MMGDEKFPPGSYHVTVCANRVTAIENIPDDDELLGIEWALSEIKDTLKHSGRLDGTFGVADLDELSELIDYLAGQLGADAVAGWRERIAP
ncbi:hypothetical protein PIGHUM_01684 [Pigmentiphaga humi]|uniref:Uncharacterized protein n=1 Tax=Pigmentiphaga humi TaxID=2478468 RepID=A0A3P4B187_9BURK|nr:hypothetical protein [Pigmentiphaga humi]VCU69621.1 hypothetical protein PIGHUM_01684 [Pigmentiphaga humi]